jgi:hypothetical protein
MRYSQPQVTSTLNAVSTIHQTNWTENPTDGVYKLPQGYFDHQRPNAGQCTAGAYEADE